MDRSSFSAERGPAFPSASPVIIVDPHDPVPADWTENVAPSSIVVDGSGCVLHADDGFATLLGIPNLAKVVGRPFADFFVCADDAERALQVVAQQSQWTGQLSLIANGSTPPTSVSCTAVRIDLPGEQGGKSLTSFAITPGRFTEATLGASAFHAMFDYCPEPSFILNDRGRIYKANTAAAQMHQCSPQDLIGRHIAELDDPDSADKAEQRLARCFAGESQRFEVNHVLPDGKQIPLEVFVTPFEYAGRTWLACFDQDLTPRRLADDLKRQAAERSHLAMTSAGHGAWDCKLLEDKTIVNDEYARMLGLDPATFVENNESFWNRIHPKDYGPTEKAYLRFLEPGGPDLDIEFRQRLPDGRWKWFRSRGRVVERDEQNRATHIVGTLTDITEIRNARRIIRTDAERSRLALAAAKQGLYDLNVQTGECHVSDEYALMLGYDPVTFVETNAFWIERLHPDDHEPVKQTYLDYVAGKTDYYRVEFRQRMKGGGWKWILSIGKIVEHDEDGEPLRMVGTHTDISDIKAAQEILRKNAELPRLALSSGQHALWDFDVKTHAFACNDDYATMLGYDPADFTETLESFSRRLHPDDRERVLNTLDDYAHDRIDVFREGWRELTRAGDWVWLLSTAKIIERDEQGSPKRIIGTRMNISEMKAAEKNLELKQKQAMEAGRLSLANGLASVVAHELNQPLCAAVNHLAALQHALGDRPVENQAIRQEARYASDAAHRAANIVRRYRELFGKQQPHAVTCDLPELFSNTLELIASEIQSNGIQIHKDYDPKTPTIAADPTLLQQVLINLINNAIEAMACKPAEQRELTLSLAPAEDDGFAIIRIADVGPGFPPDDIDSLFDLKHSSKDGGLGMGLCICRMIVKAHSGEIALEQTSANGSIFIIRLPISSPKKEGLGNTANDTVLR